MRANAAASRYPLRWLVIGALALVAVLVVALAVYLHGLLQPQRFTSLLERNLAGVGLELDLQAPAEPALFPRPAVRLSAFSLRRIGSDTPVIRANGATIVVPWSAVLRGKVAIERVEVQAPSIDLGQLQSLLSALPHRSGPPHLPNIATGISIDGGTLTRNGNPLLFDVGLRTGALAPGKTFHLDASARTAAGQRFAASLDLLPSPSHDGRIDLDPLQLRVEGPGAMTLGVRGKGSWRGGGQLALQLAGTLRHHALAPAAAASGAAAAPSGAGADTAAAPGRPLIEDQVSLEVQPTQGTAPMTANLKLTGPGTHVDLRLLPTRFGPWWDWLMAASSGQPPPSAPLRGTASIQELEFGGIKATGIRIEALPPSAAASAPATASSAAPASGGP